MQIELDLSGSAPLPCTLVIDAYGPEKLLRFTVWCGGQAYGGSRHGLLSDQQTTDLRTLLDGSSREDVYGRPKI